MASDYLILVLLHPLLARLAVEAPNVRLLIRPVSAQFQEELHRHHSELGIIPRDSLAHGASYPSRVPFTDRFVRAVDADNSSVGDALTLEHFGIQPYLAYSTGHLESLAERQLDAAGTPRNLEVSTESFVLAPYLLPGTQLITLIPERLGLAVQQQLDIKLLEPPMPLNDITEVMCWTPRHDHDPAHVWLRGLLSDLAQWI